MRIGLAVTASILACVTVGMLVRNTAMGAAARVGSHTPSRTGVIASAGTGSLQQVTVNVDGMVRTFELFVPPNDSSQHRLPLVLVYHGAGGNAVDTAQQTGLLGLAERRQGMIVASLQGYEDTWNDGAGETPAEEAGIDDLGFTEAVLHLIETKYFVDMRHVTATGLSNGAIFVELLGCRLASDFTLTMPVEGQMATRVSSGCRPSRPVSVYEIHATADKVIPYAGGTFPGVGGPVTVLSARASARRWAQLDRCSLRPTTVKSSVSGGSVLTRYAACQGRVQVTLESVQGGSHDWPHSFATTLVNVAKSLRAKRTALTP